MPAGEGGKGHGGLLGLFTKHGQGGHSKGAFAATSPMLSLPAQEYLPALSRPTAEAMVVAIDHLSANALDLEGLYRVSGSKLEVDRIKASLKAGPPLPVDLLVGSLDKHAICGAIKKLLQEHEPLLTYKLYDDFLAIGSKESSTRKDSEYGELVAMLPPVSMELLTHLIQHLREVADACGRNRMTIENLAATIGVNLIRKSESIEGVTVQRLERERRVVIDLIRAPMLFLQSVKSAGTSSACESPAPLGPAPASDGLEADVFSRTVKISWRSGDARPTEEEVRTAMERWGTVQKVAVRPKSVLVMFSSKESVEQALCEYRGPWKLKRAEKSSRQGHEAADNGEKGGVRAIPSPPSTTLSGAMHSSTPSPELHAPRDGRVQGALASSSPSAVSAPEPTAWRRSVSFTDLLRDTSNHRREGSGNRFSVRGLMGLLKGSDNASKSPHLSPQEDVSVKPEAQQSISPGVPPNKPPRRGPSLSDSNSSEAKASGLIKGTPLPQPTALTWRPPVAGVEVDHLIRELEKKMGRVPVCCTEAVEVTLKAEQKTLNAPSDQPQATPPKPTLPPPRLANETVQKLLPSAQEPYLPRRPSCEAKSLSSACSLGQPIERPPPPLPAPQLTPLIREVWPDDLDELRLGVNAPGVMSASHASLAALVGDLKESPDQFSQPVIAPAEPITRKAEKKARRRSGRRQLTAPGSPPADAVSSPDQRTGGATSATNRETYGDDVLLPALTGHLGGQDLSEQAGGDTCRWNKALLRATMPAALTQASAPSGDSTSLRPGRRRSRGTPSPPHAENPDTMRALRSELAEQKSRYRKLESKLQVAEETWAKEAERLKESSTTSNETLLRLQAELMELRKVLVEERRDKTPNGAAEHKKDISEQRQHEAMAKPHSERAVGDDEQWTQRRRSARVENDEAFRGIRTRDGRRRMRSGAASRDSCEKGPDLDVQGCISEVSSRDLPLLAGSPATPQRSAWFVDRSAGSQRP